MGKPRGVKVIRANGDELPLDLVHEGVDNEGMDNWLIATEIEYQHGDYIHIDAMPPRTGIALPKGWFTSQ